MVVVNMAGSCTFVIWTIIILAVILLKDLQGVFSGNNKVDCGPLYDPLKDMDFPYGARITWPSNIGIVVYKNHSTTVGSVAEFRCEKGYYVQGPKYAVCGSNKKWHINEKVLFCDRINCIEPTFDIEHGKIETSSEDISPRTYILNSIYWVTCDNGFKPNGSAIRVCLVNGTDNDSLYKGIWSQRDEDGKMLFGGNTLPKCIKDTYLIEWENYKSTMESNKTEHVSPRVDSVYSHDIERVFLVSVCVLCVLLIGIIITMSCVLKYELCGWQHKSGSRVTSKHDIEQQTLLGKSESETNTMIKQLIQEKKIKLDFDILIEQLLGKSESELKPIINQLLEKKDIKLADLAAYNNDIEIEQLLGKSESELKPIINQLLERKDIKIADLAAYNNDIEIEQLLGKSKSELKPIINTLIQQKNIKFADLQPYVSDYDRLEELKLERCLKCVNNGKYIELKHKRKQLVDTLVSIEQSIKKVENLKNVIVPNNNRTDNGVILWGEIQRIAGSIKVCDKSRSEVVTGEGDLEIKDAHIEVTHLKRRLRIPCEYCKQMEHDCEVIEEQIKRLECVLLEIYEGRVKIRTLTNTVSNILANKSRNLIWFMSDIISQAKHYEKNRDGDLALSDDDHDDHDDHDDTCTASGHSGHTNNAQVDGTPSSDPSGNNTNIMNTLAVTESNPDRESESHFAFGNKAERGDMSQSNIANESRTVNKDFVYTAQRRSNIKRGNRSFSADDITNMPNESNTDMLVPSGGIHKPVSQRPLVDDPLAKWKTYFKELV